ncbi:MAG TPA: tRNA lysidine(34) synthetase TilS [Burkholderiales bacterium]|nr:tRNA lysidine(34) synthetase TilS [Burkholderiales bacterium]
MASSRKSKASRVARDSLLDRVAACLSRHVGKGERITIALSGGIDSVVLTDLLARLARRGGFVLSAVHVNHQLSPHAGRWASFCRRFCRARGIPLRVARVSVPRGNSIEGAARAARFEVFRGLRTDYIALAHNQDDQAETLLLQLLRGAGVRGLAAMPVRGELSAAHPTTSFNSAHDERNDTFPPKADERGEARTKLLLRPLLDVPRSEIEAYATKRRLQWVEDESNAETYFLRNFLRHDILPAIERRYPGYRTTLSRSARHFAEASQLLDDLARIDALQAMEHGTLALEALRRLSAPRARNLLRHFLSLHGLSLPADRLQEALRQLLTARRDAKVSIGIENVRLRRFADRLHVVRNAGTAFNAIEWRGEREVALPELGGMLEFTREGRDRISLARLQSRTVTIGVRRGGEYLKPDCRRPRRSLKNLLQEARIPPWQRERTPLLFCDGKLVWAAGVGVDCAYRARESEPAVCPLWRTTP